MLNNYLVEVVVYDMASGTDGPRQVMSYRTHYNNEKPYTWGMEMVHEIVENVRADANITIR